MKNAYPHIYRGDIVDLIESSPVDNKKINNIRKTLFSAKPYKLIILRQLDDNLTDGIPVISFDIKTDNLDEIGIIIANQFKKLQLLDRYKEQCNDELSSLYNEMIEYYTMSNSIDTCISILTVRINSLQKIYGKNYWKVCLYKALSMAPETFQEFLSYSSFNN